MSRLSKTFEHTLFDKVVGLVLVKRWKRKIDHMLRSRLPSASSVGFSHPSLIDHSRNDRYSYLTLQVKKDGFLLVDSVFSGDVLTKLSGEFDDLIANAESSGHHVDRHDGATCLRVCPSEALNPRRYAATVAFFSSNVCRSIAGHFFGASENKLAFNSELFIHKTPPTTAPLSNILHWDKRPTLKFWVYIDDIPVEAGPMAIEKGSSERNSIKRQRSIGMSPDDLTTIDNSVVADTSSLLRLTGRAGTILIHHTDASHRATKVEHGFTRRIMRGHTRLS